MSNNWNDSQAPQGDAGNNDQNAWNSDQSNGQGGWDSNAGQTWDSNSATNAGQDWDQNAGQQAGGWDQAAGQQWDANQQAGYAGYAAAGGQLPPAQGMGPGGLPLASWGKRALGALFDIVLPLLVLGVIWYIVFPSETTTTENGVNFRTSNNPGAFLNWLVLAPILAALNGKTGMTPGRKIAKTQLVGEDGVPLTFGKLFLRYLAHYIDNVICCIGFLFPLWDSRRQTLADKIVKTYVVDVSNAAPLPPRP